MKLNPFLPSGEYIPDGEPHIFNGRVYLYGSHDKFGGETFCMNDYVCYSAPVENLGDWRYEGVIFRRNQDKRKDGYLYAPDVAQGNDGKYYLYYSLSNSSVIGVAVCDTPAGKYEYLGEVCYSDGTVFGTKDSDPFLFDPAILVENNRVILYSGSCPYRKFNEEQLRYIREHSNKNWNLFEKQMKSEYSIAVDLADDMITITSEIKKIAPGAFAKDAGGFCGHEFFEASSVRKFKDKYYFIYSSKSCHELCYAVSDKPDGGFVYGGVLISNAGKYNDALCQYETYCGNNHGSIIDINGQYYIFYHKQTNRSSFSRQACFEKIKMKRNGRFIQAEITSSCSEILPLGEYPAYIACILNVNGQAAFSASCTREGYENAPYITQDEPDGDDGRQYIANLCAGGTALFRYFDTKQATNILVWVRGNGELSVNDVKISVAQDKWGVVALPFYSADGTITFKGICGKADILKFKID